jgi:hypothetical protein
MPFAAFRERCPEVASRETRTISVLPAAQLGVPAGDYHFIEMFCDEPGCDCRRVFFTVLSSTQKQVQAVIAWGWEERAFYTRWLGINDPGMAREMQGPILNLASPQSEHAEALLELARKMLLADPVYVERIKRHYALFRSKIPGRVQKAKKVGTRYSPKRGRGSGTGS